MYLTETLKNSNIILITVFHKSQTTPLQIKIQVKNAFDKKSKINQIHCNLQKKN